MAPNQLLELRKQLDDVEDQQSVLCKEYECAHEALHSFDRTLRTFSTPPPLVPTNAYRVMELIKHQKQEIMSSLRVQMGTLIVRRKQIINQVGEDNF